MRYINIPIEVFNSIAGYKPNFIVQGFIELKPERLRPIFDKYGNIERLFELFSHEQSEEAPKSSESIYVNVPQDLSPEVVTNAKIVPFFKEKNLKGKRGKFKIDYDERNRKNAITGSRGETIVLNEEKKRLSSLGRPDLAKKVIRVSVDDDSKGYDILSFEEDGRERYIEVKTTTAKTNAVQFFLSANEYEAAKTLENYYFYIVDRINTQQPRITPIGNPFGTDMFSIHPESYIVEGKRV